MAYVDPSIIPVRLSLDLLNLRIRFFLFLHSFSFPLVYAVRIDSFFFFCLEGLVRLSVCLFLSVYLSVLSVCSSVCQSTNHTARVSFLFLLSMNLCDCDRDLVFLALCLSVCQSVCIWVLSIAYRSIESKKSVNICGSECLFIHLSFFISQSVNT